MKILIITEYFMDDTNANAHCTRLVVDALVDQDVDVDVICVDKKESIISIGRKTIYIVQNQDYVTNNKPCSIFLGHMMRIPLIKEWPLESPKTAKAIIAEAELLISQNDYNGVIAIHKSYLSVFCLKYLKKKYSKLNTILYLLDPIANQIDKYLGIRKYLFWLVQMREKEAFAIFDNVVNMKCNQTDYLDNKYADKILYADFPLIYKKRILEKREITKNYLINKHERTIRLIYFGTLNSIYRSPEVMMMVLGEVSKQINIKVDIYTRGDCFENMITKAKQYNGVFNISDFVSQEEIYKKASEADFVLNVGNAMSHMVPSKVFDMIMLNKPIISFSKQEEDYADVYLKKYNYAIIVKENKDILVLTKEIIHFINNVMLEQKKELSVDWLEETFLENTPHFTAVLLKNICCGSK